MSFETVMPPYGSSDPDASFLSTSCLDFLLIELVPLTYRVTREVDAVEAGPDAPSSTLAKGGAAAEQGRESVSSAAGAATAPATGTGTDMGTAASLSKRMDEDEERDAVFYRLEKLGYRVGQGLVERYVVCGCGALPTAPPFPGRVEEGAPGKICRHIAKPFAAVCLRPIQS